MSRVSGSAQSEHLVIPATELPVRADADVVVLGGSFYGIGAALAAARSGRSVVLAEPSTYLGREVTHTGRWWLPVDALRGMDDDVAHVLFDGAGDQDENGEIGLWPDGVKRGLEDVLLAAGVRILYGCGFLSEHEVDGRWAVVVGTKSGRQVLCADVVVASPVSATGSSLWHALELTGLDGTLPARLEVPDTLGALGAAVHLHHGCLGDGHVLVEYGVAMADVTDEEWALRQLGIELVEHLVTTHRAMAGAWLAGVGAEPLPAAGFERPVVRPADFLADGARSLATGGSHPIPATGPDAGSVRLTLPAVVETPYRRPGRPLPRQRVPEVAVPVATRVGVLVVGAGTSGASAAAAAAGEGVDTLAVDMHSGFGGSGTYGTVNSYWYGRRTGPAEDVRTRTEWLQKRLSQGATRSRWNIETKAHALRDLVTERGARVRTRSFPVAALVEDDRLAGAVLSTPDGLCAVLADVVLDATGDADVVALAGADTRYGAERTHSTMWYSLGHLVEPGRSRNNFGGIVDIADVDDYTRAVLAARRRGGRLYDHGTYLAPRESRTVVGRVTLTLTHQLTDVHWPDVVNVHFSNHDIKGKSDSVWTLMGLIPPNLEIEVPLRALLPRGLDGVLVLGKALSVTHDGLAAVRMQADQENLGATAGVLAARCVRDGTTPATTDVAAFQKELVGRGLLPAHVLDESAGPRWQVPASATPTELTGRLVAELPLYQYSDVGMAHVHRTGLPFVELIARRDLDVDDELCDALTSQEPLVRQVAAQVLTCRGHRAGVDALVKELTELLTSGDTLPPRTASIRHVQLPPDQAAMPMPAYLLYTLGVARDPRAVELWRTVVDRVDTSDDALRDMHAGTFAYVDAVCFGAERLGSPASFGLLRELHRRPTLRAQCRTEGLDEDVFAERKAMLELAIGRALARSGAADGYDVLLTYLRDERALLARAAHSELTLLLGHDAGDDPAAWDAACATHRVEPTPLPPRYDLSAPDGVAVWDDAAR